VKAVAVAEQPDQGDGGQREALLATIDTTVAHPARVYDYWLGGRLVQVHQWRPGPDDAAPPDFATAHGGVARKP
jgi:hypothetical protein